MSTALDKPKRLSPSTSMAGAEDKECFSNKKGKEERFTGVRAAAVIMVGDDTEGG